MLLIAITLPIAGTIPTSINKSTINQDSERLLFLGYTSGTALVLWGANGYPGDLGEPEYSTNDSKGFFIFPLTGIKGRELIPPEGHNITEAWDIENVRTFPIMLIRWNHDGEKHRLFARFYGDDDTDFQYLSGMMPNPPWEAYYFWGGLNIEWDISPENYTNLSNLLFTGRYDGEKISGRANCMVFYNTEEEKGFILINLMIENLDTTVCFGWSTVNWTPWHGMAKTLKAYFKII